jgi:hypothetical protein
MAIEDTFSGAKNAYTHYFAYLNTVAQEIGMEQAVALHTKMCEAMGARQGKIIKEQAGGDGFDAEVVGQLAKKFIEGLGISSQVTKENPQEVITKIGRCPLYEACQVVGLDAENIESLCHAGALKFMDTMVKQLNPNLNYEVRKFRTSAEDVCEEAIVMS